MGFRYTHKGTVVESHKDDGDLGIKPSIFQGRSDQFASPEAWVNSAQALTDPVAIHSSVLQNFLALNWLVRDPVHRS